MAYILLEVGCYEEAEEKFWDILDLVEGLSSGDTVYNFDWQAVKKEIDDEMKGIAGK